MMAKQKLYIQHNMMSSANLETLDRRSLQDLAKKHGLKANASSANLISELSKLIPTESTKSGSSNKRKAESQDPVGSVLVDKSNDAGDTAQQVVVANALPFENHRFVVTGTFPTSSDMIERRIVALGGVVVKAVSKSTTYVMLGENGTTDYGGQTGTGSKKYKDAKKMKCVVMDYAELLRLEAAGSGGGGGGGASGASSVPPESKLQGEWTALLAAIAQGVALGLWAAPEFPPPASPESIAALEAEMGFRIGGYADLLLLSDGPSWHAKHDGEHVSVVFGGTGDGEDDVRNAFNYSGDYGRKHFKQKKQVPLQMLDYDFCVDVFEVRQGRVMQDDRECQTYRLMSPSLSAWLQSRTDKLLALVSTAPPPDVNASVAAVPDVRVVP